MQFTTKKCLTRMQLYRLCVAELPNVYFSKPENLTLKEPKTWGKKSSISIRTFKHSQCFLIENQRKNSKANGLLYGSKMTSERPALRRTQPITIGQITHVQLLQAMVSW